MNKYAVAREPSIQPVTKAHRQETIRTVLRKAPPRSQAEMITRLRGAGIRVTQSTLSRDLRDLGLLKGPGGYREAGPQDLGAGSQPRLHEMQRMMRSYLTSATRAGNLVVLKTPAGLAHALGVALDRAALPEVTGTVAGDDTLFAATPHPSSARALERRLRGLIGRR